MSERHMRTKDRASVGCQVRVIYAGRTSLALGELPAFLIETKEGVSKSRSSMGVNLAWRDGK